LQHKLTFLIALLCLIAFVTMISGNQASSATHFEQVTTSTMLVGTSVSTSLAHPQQIFNNAFTVLSTTGTNLLCEFKTFNFTAATGQYVYGNFTSDNPISFFLVQPSSYQTWLKTSSCGNAGDAIASQLVATSYSFNATIPTSGAWVIVLVNSSTAKNADGFLVAYLSSSSYTITQPLMTTITASLTYASVSSTSSVPSTGIAGFPIASIVFGIALGLIVVTILRRRESARRERT